jgi:hypothetical protein
MIIKVKKRIIINTINKKRYKIELRIPVERNLY